jgi:phenylpropionate dioxygenase-like ring-hydroxylating dioxygenase large terminal subunit
MASQGILHPVAGTGSRIHRRAARPAVRTALPHRCALPRAPRPTTTHHRRLPLPALADADADAAPAATTTTTSPSGGSGGDSTFAWRSAWYPVALESYLDKAGPAQVSVLGTEVVLWWAPAGSDDGASAASDQPAWRAALDVCPHRLAALSSGRLEGGRLSCRYHGWEFSGDGACVANPQAPDARAEATVCGSGRSRLATLPCRVEQGLVWVWPTPGREAAEAAASTPLPLYPETAGDDPVTFPGSDGDWGFQVAPVDWTLMTENSLDPSHAPFLHEKVMGPATRAGAAPCVMRLADPPGLGDGGFTVTHGGYTMKQQAEGMAGVRTFTAPGRLRAEVSFLGGVGDKRDGEGGQPQPSRPRGDARAWPFSFHATHINHPSSLLSTVHL